MALHDVSGRLVRRADLGQRPAGPTDWHWDGRDARGRPVRPGLLLVRLTGGRPSLTRRRVMLP